MSEKNVNKEGWLWLAPEYFNRWRVFPRSFVIFYFWLAFETAMWYMGLPSPSAAQSAFASAIIGAGAAWFGLYVNSGSRTIAYSPPSQDYQQQHPQPMPPYTPVTTVPVNHPHLSPPPPADETNTQGIPVYRIRGE